MYCKVGHITICQGNILCWGDTMLDRTKPMSLQMTDDDDNWLTFPDGKKLTTLMYTIQSFSPSAKDFLFGCDYKFPYCYNRYLDWSHTFTYDAQVRAAVDGFAGYLPHTLNLRSDSRLPNTELNLFGALMYFWKSL